jgi:hypothetical protein
MKVDEEKEGTGPSVAETKPKKDHTPIMNMKVLPYPREEPESNLNTISSKNMSKEPQLSGFTIFEAAKNYS